VLQGGIARRNLRRYHAERLVGEQQMMPGFLFQRNRGWDLGGSQTTGGRPNVEASKLHADRVSEHELHGELDHTIVPAGQSAVSADVVGNLSKVRGGERNVSAGLARVGCGARNERVQTVG